MTYAFEKCRVAPETAEALLSSEAKLILERVAGRVERRGWPRPGGAAREMTREFTTAAGERIEVHLPAMRDGRSVAIIHHVGIGSIHSGNILRVPGTVLPETIMMSAPGRRLGDLVDLSRTGMTSLSDALVTDVFNTDHRGQALLIHTDAETVCPAITTNG